MSWVSRRLELVCGVSDNVLAAVRQGTLSTWAATRVVAPLARANSAQATELLAALAASPLTTRELQTWFTYYRSSPRAARERMVSHPRLFIQSLRAQDERRADTHLRDGPEGQCANDVRQLLALIKRLRQQLPTLSRAGLLDTLRGALTRLRTALDNVQSELTRSLDHDSPFDSRCGPDLANPRQESARNQPRPETLA